jgi:hypothetical protein
LVVSSSFGLSLLSLFNDFKTIVHLVGFLFIFVIADTRNHEPEINILVSVGFCASSGGSTLESTEYVWH